MPILTVLKVTYGNKKCSQISMPDFPKKKISLQKREIFIEEVDRFCSNYIIIIISRLDDAILFCQILLSSQICAPILQATLLLQEWLDFEVL